MQKNSFNIKDKTTNFGFIISLTLIILIFLILPVVFGLLRFPGGNPVFMVLLPSLVIIPILCISVFFVGRAGDLAHKLKLTNLCPEYIPISFLAAVLILFAMGEFMYLYHRLLAWLDIKTDPPVIEAILKKQRFQFFSVDFPGNNFSGANCGGACFPGVSCSVFSRRVSDFSPR